MLRNIVGCFLAVSAKQHVRARKFHFAAKVNVFFNLGNKPLGIVLPGQKMAIAFAPERAM
jgi:hypothetical protein